MAFLRYLGIGVAALAIVAGAVYLLDRAMAPPTTPKAAATNATNSKPQPAADEQMPPTAAQNDQLVSLVGEARRLAAVGKFDAAEVALQKADEDYSNWHDNG